MELKTANLMLSELPETEKPREKLRLYGAGSLSNAELLALLIGSGTESESAITLAQRILALEEGGLGGFADYEVEEFMALKGIGIAKASSIVAALELGRRIASAPPKGRIHITNPAEIARLFMDEMQGCKKEYFKIALFNIKMEFIGRMNVSMGGINSTPANPREIFTPALKKGAHGICLVHNHPSGNPSPSAADISVTNQAIASGRILGVEVIDHIIIGDHSYYSFREKFPEMF